MGKLYIFGIGGTGSRVIKSLTMLLASGVQCQVDTIVPIIIDPDDSAAALTETVKLMKSYIRIREKLDFSNDEGTQFFKTEIQEFVENYRLPLNNTRDQTFKDYMSVDTMSDKNKAIVNMLFSKKNLESNMKVGFKGNPNIGSVVLNQFADSNEFRDFANSFQQGDKIFIISSIFGGTGASGFPLLLKTLRSNRKIPMFGLINNAQIGAISVLPYFGIRQDEGSEIDSGTFISKTKSALSYYYSNISRNQNTVNALYYIADEIRNQYENCEGGREQKNNAHIIELISALAILDFAAGDYEKGITHKEFGLKEDSSEIIFTHLGDASRNQLQKPVTQFFYFSKYLKDMDMSLYSTQSWAIDIKIDSELNRFIENIRDFQKEYMRWLEEMDNNRRRFSPFVLDNNQKGIFDAVKGYSPNKRKTWAQLIMSNYALFDNYLNSCKQIKDSKIEHQFLKLFYDATNELVKEKFNF